MSEETVRRRKFRAQQTRVAVLAVLALLLLAYGVYRVGEVFDVFARRYEVVTLVPSALGLREGAPVTLAGQRIGQVSRIDFVPPGRRVGGNNLLIRLAIAEGVREQIRGDSRAFLRTQGLLGDRFVDISPGTPAAAPLAQGDTLLAGETVDLDDFMAQASSAIDTALLVVRGIRDIADGIRRGEGTFGLLLTDERLYRELLGATTALRGTLVRINRADGTLGRLIEDPRLYESLQRAVARLDEVGALLLQGDGTVGQLLRSDTLHRSLLGAVARADTAMAGVADFVARMTEGEGTVQKLMTDPALYDELLKAITDVQTLIEAIRRDPERYAPDVRVRVF